MVGHFVHRYVALAFLKQISLKAIDIIVVAKVLVLTADKLGILQVIEVLHSL